MEIVQRSFVLILILLEVTQILKGVKLPYYTEGLNPYSTGSNSNSYEQTEKDSIVNCLNPYSTGSNSNSLTHTKNVTRRES